MTTPKNCPRCNAELDPEEGELCLKCLLTGALSSEEERGSAEDRYRLEEVVGRGGMGAVHAATDTLFGRRVALKRMLRPDSAAERRRFLNEARITGQLEHPSIVPIYELAEDEFGAPFYTMKLIRGKTLKAVLTALSYHAAGTAAEYSLADLLTIFQKACDGVAFAHAHGVVHRDLKPENIEIGAYGEVLVLDWGLAKVLPTSSLDPEPLCESDFEEVAGESGTLLGAVMGTPHYMAPEQAAGRNDLVDARTDVFALGAILYNLLALRPPLSGSKEEVFAKLQRGGIVNPTALPPPPGAPPLMNPTAPLPTSVGGMIPMWQSYASKPQPPKWPHCPGGRIPSALAAVAMKALELRPEARYQTVRELQNEISAYQSGFAPRAEKARWWKQFALLMRRHKPLTLTLATSAALLGISSTVFLARLIASERRAVSNEKVAAAAAAGERRERERAENDALQRARALSHSQLVQALHAVEQGDANDAALHLVRSLRADPTHPTALQRLVNLLAYQDFALLRRTWQQGSLISVAELSRDGRVLVTGSEDGRACLWRLDSEDGAGPVLPHGSAIKFVSLSQDGQSILTVTKDEQMRVWSAMDGRLLAGPWLERRLESATLSPSGEAVLTTGSDSRVRITRITERKLVLDVAADPFSAEFSPDGTRVLLGDWDGSARIIDAGTGLVMCRFKGRGGEPSVVHFSPDGQAVLIAGSDGTSHILDGRTGQERTKPMRQTRRVRSAKFSSDGTRLVTASEDHTVKVWDTQTGDLLAGPFLHRQVVTGAAFDSQARRLLTISADHSVHVWDVRTGQPLAASLRHESPLLLAEFTAIGHHVVTACDHDSLVRVWDVRPGRMLAAPITGNGWALSAQFSPDGANLLTCSDDGSARVWNVVTREPVCPPLSHEAPRKAQLSDSWTRATDSSGGPERSRRLISATFSSDARFIVTASDDETARVWDAKTGRPQTPPLRHDKPVLSARFGSGGAQIVTATDNQTREWDAGTGNPLGPPKDKPPRTLTNPYSEDLEDLAADQSDFRPNTYADVHAPLRGSRLESILADFPVILVSPSGIGIEVSEDQVNFFGDRGGDELLPKALLHDSRIFRAALGPDERLLTVSADRTARLWDLQSRRLLADHIRHAGIVHDGAFSHDGKMIVTLVGPSFYVWPIAAPSNEAPKWFLRLAEAVATGGASERNWKSFDVTVCVDVLADVSAELASAPPGDAWAAWGRWFLSDRRSRPITPISSLIVSQYLADRLAESRAASLEEAERLAAGDVELLNHIQVAREKLAAEGSAGQREP